MASVEVPVRRLAWRPAGRDSGSRRVPEETAVALTYDGSTQAVMMATPADLEDFALGFSLTEGIVDSPAGIERLAVIASEHGIELQMRLASVPSTRLAARRRQMLGPTGCGLCGIESLAEAVREPRAVGIGRICSPAEIMAALGALAPAQTLNRATGGVHAAAYWHPVTGLAFIREDVGRHNALDKLAGALARQSADAGEGIVLLTSRVSVEMVQKAAAIGAAVVVAVSVPTAAGIRTAELAGITLVAVARSDGFEVFTRPERIGLEAEAVARAS